MQEGKQFKPVRVKATTKESAIEQALQMTGAVQEEVDVEVLEENDKGVTVRVSPLGTIAAPPAVKTSVKKEEIAASAQEIVDDESAGDEEEETEAELAAEAAAEDSNFSSSSSLASSEAQQRACDVAQDFLDRMGLDAQAKLAQMPEGVGPLASSHPTEVEVSGEFAGGSSLPRTFLDIEGEDVGILIGKHGQTLRAFQYLLNLSLNNSNSNSTEGVYVMVDAGDYRARRATVLERAVHNAIERARGEHRAVRLEPMPAHERRLVHLLLQSETDLTTSSEGREPWRRVVVAPEGVRASFSRSGSRSGNSGRKPSSRDGNRNRRDAN
ncbi:MAG: R3H domain-containing nucleic acid-binding protein [Abditibacteriaceae bacterium]